MPNRLRGTAAVASKSVAVREHRLVGSWIAERLRGLAINERATPSRCSPFSKTKAKGWRPLSRWTRFLRAFLSRRRSAASLHEGRNPKGALLIASARAERQTGRHALTAGKNRPIVAPERVSSLFHGWAPALRSRGLSQTPSPVSSLSLRFPLPEAERAVRRRLSARLDQR